MKKIFLIVAVVALLVTGCGKKDDKKQTDNKGNNAVNENKTVKSFDDQTIDGILISDFNLNFVDNATNIYAKVKNTTEESVKIKQINITLTDSEGKENKTLFYVGRTLKAGEEIPFQTSITGNVATSTKVEYEIKF